MSKYQISVQLSASFVFDTDDWKENIEQEEFDPTDTDSVHDFIREVIEGDGISEYDEPNVEEVTVKLLPK